MVGNRIKELREARGWSMFQLAQTVGCSISTINRLEKGRSELISEWLPKIADAFGVSWSDVVDINVENNNVKQQFADDAVTFEVQKEHPLFEIRLKENAVLWKMRSNVLDALGIMPDDVVVVDISQRARESVHTGDIVIVQAGGRKPTKPVTHVRQFVEPDLFITNSRYHNERPFNRVVDDVRIEGKVIHRIVSIGR
jgi:transcriptional regulator with XRE-family HTH domain